LGRTIRVLWLKTFAGTIVFVAMAAICGSATDPIADLKAGAAALDAKRYPAAIAALEPVLKRLPKIADYTAFFIASAKCESGDSASVAKTLEPVFKMTPISPLVPRAALLEARAFEQKGDPNAAVEVLKKYFGTLPQPAGDLALAAAFEAAGDPVNAVAYDQRIYYGFPVAPEAPASEAALARLRASLGAQYPPAMPGTMLSRAMKLIDAKQYMKARAELESLTPELSGPEKDLARVRIGVVDYDANETARAYRELSALEVSTPEADAERLHYLLLCAQRLKNQDEVNEVLGKLGRLYPNSPWRLKALIAAANHSLVENQIQAYEPIFRACYESFPKDPQAAGCHWKVTWGHYLRRQPDAGDLLRAHVRLFPSADTIPAALYFLGRLSEGSHDPSAALAYYTEILTQYPNNYYNVLARDRIKQMGANGPAFYAASSFHNGQGRSIFMPTRHRKRASTARESSPPQD
jgi:soluble lytic murein transglycosylase